MMRIATQPPTLESLASGVSKKRRRDDDSDQVTPNQFGKSSGQLSLLDVWGHRPFIQEGRGWKNGVTFKEKSIFRNRQNQTFNKYDRTTDYYGNGTYLNNSFHQDYHLISPGNAQAIYPGSIASSSSSIISSFSLHASRVQSDKTDGFDDLDFEFDPKLFVLETDPKHGLHPSWLDQLKPILMQPEIISLHQQLGPSHLDYDYKAGQQPVSLLTQVLPHAHQLYNWSRLTPLDQVKVVILGSKPSQSPSQSHGLAFSQPVGCQRLSGPIESIHQELAIEYPDQFEKPNHGSLVSWAKSGVLLLNEIQTTRRDDPNEHFKFGWSEFTTKILEVVSRFGGSMHSSNTTTGPMSDSIAQSAPTKGIVFIAWGEHALNLIKSAGIYSSDRNHHVLSCKGSPYANSAHDDGFFNNRHFISSNKFWSSTYGPETQIDWWKLEALDTPS